MPSNAVANISCPCCVSKPNDFAKLEGLNLTSLNSNNSGAAFFKPLALITSGATSFKLINCVALTPGGKPSMDALIASSNKLLTIFFLYRFIFSQLHIWVILSSYSS